MKVTLDTNVLISGSFWSGDSFRILKLIDKGAVELVLSDEIVKEYYETLQSEDIMDKVANKRLILFDIAERCIQQSTTVSPTLKFSVIKDDPDDDIILECAVEGEVDYIISRDMHLLKLKSFKGISIVNPEEFLKLGKFSDKSKDDFSDITKFSETSLKEVWDNKDDDVWNVYSKNKKK